MGLCVEIHLNINIRYVQKWNSAVTEDFLEIWSVNHEMLYTYVFLRHEVKNFIVLAVVRYGIRSRNVEWVG